MTIMFGEYMRTPRARMTDGLRYLACLTVLVMLLAWMGSDAMADASPVSQSTCTSSTDYEINYPSGSNGLFTQIGNTISGYVENTTSDMYKGIAASPNITGAVKAAVTLYIAIYGILFMFGMVQVTAFELIVRLAKIAVVGIAISSSGYLYFDNTFYNFFYNGMNEIISVMLSSTLGGLTSGGGPFAYMDDAIAMIISPKMVATLLAAFTTGPYGLGIGLVLMMSLTSFIKSLMSAMWVYITATVLLLFLFAMAPIFIPCILFERTKNLFDGWLNQIINCVLQPIFLFAFFSFFVILFESCLDQLFTVPVCWTPVADAFKGTPFEGQFWRFAFWDCTHNQWAPFDGVWDFNGIQDGQDHSPGSGCPGAVHPFGIVLPLTLWIIADLASRFNDVVIQVAQEIAGAGTDLSKGMQQLGSQLAGGGGGGNNASSQAGGASTGTRTPTGGATGATPSATPPASGGGTPRTPGAGTAPPVNIRPGGPQT